VSSSAKFLSPFFFKRRNKKIQLGSLELFANSNSIDDGDPNYLKTIVTLLLLSPQYLFMLLFPSASVEHPLPLIFLISYTTRNIILIVSLLCQEQVYYLAKQSLFGALSGVSSWEKCLEFKFRRNYFLYMKPPKKKKNLLR